MDKRFDKNKFIAATSTIFNFRFQFGWDSKLQGVVLSSFYYGYISTQLFGGWMARKIGGHIVRIVAYDGVVLNGKC